MKKGSAQYHLKQLFKWSPCASAGCWMLKGLIRGIEKDRTGVCGSFTIDFQPSWYHDYYKVAFDAAANAFQTAVSNTYFNNMISEAAKPDNLAKIF